MTSENSNRNRILAVIVILLLLGSIGFLTRELGRNARLEENLNNERLTGESLLSEKLSLEKDIARIKEEFAALQNKNAVQTTALAELTQQFADAESKLKKVKQQGNNVAALKKQNKELADLRAIMEQQLEGYRGTVAQLNSEKGELEVALNSSQEQNKKLLAEIKALRLGHLDDILIEPTKKNQKLTIKAGRTRQISVHADVAAEADALTFTLSDPNGKRLSDANGSFVINAVTTAKQKPQAFYVASDTYTPPEYKTIQLIYKSKTKLVRGTYSMELLNGEQPIGTLQVKLK